MEIKLHLDHESDAYLKVGGITYAFNRNGAGDLVGDVPEEAAQKFLQSPEPLFTVYSRGPGEAAQGEEGEHGQEDTDDVPAADVPEDGALALASAAYALKVRDELAELYKERFGRAASSLMRPETMVDRLARDDVAKAG